MRVNIEIECPYCGRIHTHPVDFPEPVPSKDIEVELAILSNGVDKEMQEEKEGKKQRQH